MSGKVKDEDYLKNGDEIISCGVALSHSYT